MDNKRFTSIELSLVAVAPALLLLCLAWQYFQESLYQQIGASGVFHYLLPAAALVGGYTIAANANTPVVWRVVFALSYIAVFLIGAIAVLVATGLELA